jgi:hypothetical protein
MLQLPILRIKRDFERTLGALACGMTLCEYISNTIEPPLVHLMQFGNGNLQTLTNGTWSVPNQHTMESVDQAGLPEFVSTIANTAQHAIALLDWESLNGVIETACLLLTPRITMDAAFFALHVYKPELYKRLLLADVGAKTKYGYTVVCVVLSCFHTSMVFWRPKEDTSTPWMVVMTCLYMLQPIATQVVFDKENENTWMTLLHYAFDVSGVTLFLFQTVTEDSWIDICVPLILYVIISWVATLIDNHIDKKDMCLLALLSASLCVKANWCNLPDKISNYIMMCLRLVAQPLRTSCIFYDQEKFAEETYDESQEFKDCDDNLPNEVDSQLSAADLN